MDNIAKISRSNLGRRPKILTIKSRSNLFP